MVELMEIRVEGWCRVNQGGAIDPETHPCQGWSDCFVPFPLPAQYPAQALLLLAEDAARPSQDLVTRFRCQG